MVRPLLEDNTDTFIRYNEAITILRKVRILNEQSFDTLVSSRKPFGLPSNFRNYSATPQDNKTILIYAQKDTGYISRDQIENNVDLVNSWKVFIPEAIGGGVMESDIVKPIIGAPNSACSETYVMIAPVTSEEIATNITKYIGTKFFHFLLGLKKITQHTTSKTYSFIPVQDFSMQWTDEMLYEKYGLTESEIAYIENSVWPEQVYDND